MRPSSASPGVGSRRNRSLVSVLACTSTKRCLKPPLAAEAKVSQWASLQHTSTRPSHSHGLRYFSRTTRPSSRMMLISPTTCAATRSRWRGPARRFVAACTYGHAVCASLQRLGGPPCPTRAEGVRIACDRVREAFRQYAPHKKKRCVPMTGKQKCEMVPGGCTN